MHPGEYKIQIASPRTLWKSQWYDQKYDIDTAAIINLNPGAKYKLKPDVTLQWESLEPVACTRTDNDNDNVGAVINAIGKKYTEILVSGQWDDLADPSVISRFGGIFMNCSFTDLTQGAEEILKNYVSNGGKVYTTDLAGVNIIRSLFPEKVTFMDPVEQGIVQNVTGTVVNSGLRQQLGTSSIPIKFDKGGWAPAESTSGDVTKYVTADVSTETQSKIKGNPVFLSFKYGKGAVYWMAFHLSAQQDTVAQGIMAYLIGKVGPTPPPPPSEATHWYLAEGCTAGGMETFVLVQNPNSKAVTVNLTYMTSKGSTAGPSLTLPARSRATVNVADTVPNEWNVSTMVSGGKDAIIAERTIFGNGRTWATESIGTPAPAPNWYLAEGSTAGGMETFILVQNPDPNEAQVNIVYMTSAGPVQGPIVTVPANSRMTFNVADTVPNQWEVSTKVATDGNKKIIVERSMYGNGRTWATDSIGTASPQETWYLAEGCTAGGMETFVLVQNPNNEPAHVGLTYMTSTGPVTGPSADIGPYSRMTFNVASTVPNAWDVSTKVTSTKPVVAERSVFGNSRTWATESIGVAYASETWSLAEGSTNGGMETYVLVQNPTDGAATVKLDFMTNEGLVGSVSAKIGANSRTTFNVSDYVPNQWEVSTKVTSDTAVIVERSMFGNGRAWGTDSIGAPF